MTKTTKEEERVAEFGRRATRSRTHTRQQETAVERAARFERDVAFLMEHANPEVMRELKAAHPLMTFVPQRTPNSPSVQLASRPI